MTTHSRKSASPPANPTRVMVENVNVPGFTHRVDAAKYDAMRRALLLVLPEHAPGLTQAEMLAAVREHLPEALFPGGSKAAWWAKTVQLDLEAKGLVTRSRQGRSLRWSRGTQSSDRQG